MYIISLDNTQDHQVRYKINGEACAEMLQQQINSSIKLQFSRFCQVNQLFNQPPYTLFATILLYFGESVKPY